MSRTAINLKVDQDLRKALAQLAYDQNRTLSNLIETVLRNHVAQTSSPANAK